jgi:starch synthase
MTDAVDRAIKAYRLPQGWRRLQLQAMEMDFSWDASAAKYLSLYRSVTGIETPITRPVTGPADSGTATIRA